MENKKKCAVCGAEFVPHTNRQKFCCKDCYYQNNRNYQKSEKFKEYLRSYCKERYETIKSAKCCIECYKKDERTREGKTRCYACSVKEREYRKERYLNAKREQFRSLCGAVRKEVD